ncbi:pinopsin-like [Actinia tenebrosa]|uniref:Pinopsin-like n=1 Tax=Actinia tenebrosa TaxID=6105 RepID=A0A6P8IJZ8_ACTTE|nr:pinopsin-like [Actinia tenebrosa]
MRQENLTLIGSKQNDSSGSWREEVVISPLGRWLLVSVLAATTVVVFVGNTLVLIVLHKQRRTAGQRVINMFLANLTLIDLSVSFIVLPLSMTTYIHGSWPFGETFCEINGFTTMIIGISGILTMTAIAVDRYRVIVLPVGQRLRTKHAWALLAFIWIWSIIQATPPLLGWNKYTWGQSSALCRASFTRGDGYIESVSLVSYIIPLCIMVYCYVCVYLRVRQSRRRIEMWARFNQDVWLKAEARTAKIVFTVLTFFIVSWTPFIVIYAINGAGKSIVPLAAFRFTGWLASSHSAVNPLIYLKMNKRFRKDLKAVLGCHDSKGDTIKQPANGKAKVKERKLKIPHVLFTNAAVKNARTDGEIPTRINPLRKVVQTA